MCIFLVETTEGSKVGRIDTSLHLGLCRYNDCSTQEVEKVLQQVFIGRHITDNGRRFMHVTIIFDMCLFLTLIAR